MTKTASRFFAIPNKLSIWWILILPVVFLIPRLGSYWLNPNSPYSDLLITHLPNAIYLKEALLNYHQIPLWSPAILSGYPFAADPLSGLWYPPGWLAVLIPPPWGFNLSLLLHLVGGGIGLTLFLKEEGISQLAAILGGVIFVALPKTLAHVGAGHITLVYAVCWTPWLLWAEARTSGTASPQRLNLAAGLVLGMTALADIRWIVPAGLLWLSYKLYRWSVNPDGPATAAELRTKTRDWPGVLVSMISNAGLGFLITAPLILPLIEYASLSTRSQMTTSDLLSYSLPPGRMLGLLFPMFGGSAEWVLYLGGGAAALMIYSLLFVETRRKTGFWWLLLVLSILLSMGGNIPGFRQVFSLPIMNMLRVPSRFLFLTGLCAAVICAQTIEHILQKTGEGRAARSSRIGLIILGFGAFFFILGIGLGFLTQTWSFLWGGAAALIGAVLVILVERNVLQPAIWTWVFLVFILLDLSVVNRMDLQITDRPPETAGLQQVEEQLANDPELFRTYSPSYSIPQDQAAMHGLQLADGVDPLRLVSYDAFMQKATGIPEAGYSVTLPPFASGDPDTDNRNYFPDPKILGLLNVEYIASAFDINVPGLDLLGTLSGIRLYRNQLAMPRSWVAPSKEVFDTMASPVEDLRWTPNMVSIQATGPGLLVLSEISYPGWEVRVDGSRETIETVGGVLRGVELRSGSHRIDFEFRPGWFVPAAILAGIGWLIVIMRIAINKRK